MVEHEQIMKEYELCRNQAGALQQNLEMIEGSLTELRATSNALEEIKGAKKDSEVLVPIGVDSFIKAKIIDPENVIVGIGADLAAKKTIDEARADIEARIADFEKARAEQTASLEQTISKLKELEPALQNLMSQTAGKEG